MSHFTQLKTELKDERLLKRSLTALGYSIVEAAQGESVEVRGFFEESQSADFKILTDSKYDIGFKKTESGGYEVVGDWELLPKVSGIEADAFQKGLKREYAKQTVLSIAELQGYSVESIETENGMELVVTQW
jgi:hypothetical protein